jgi:hypothetical protein
MGEWQFYGREDLSDGEHAVLIVFHCHQARHLEAFSKGWELFLKYKDERVRRLKAS